MDNKVSIILLILLCSNISILISSSSGLNILDYNDLDESKYENLYRDHYPVRGYDNENTCTTCPPGKYGSSVILLLKGNDWERLIATFDEARITTHCGSLDFSDGFPIALSGCGLGRISFGYDMEVNSSYFHFYVDGKNYINTSGLIEANEFSLDLSEGKHELKLVFSRGLEAMINEFVRITYLEILGIGKNCNCKDCIAGTFNDIANAYMCELCPENTFSLDGASSCEACPEDKYSNAGSKECLVRPPCFMKDTYRVYSECFANSTRDLMWKWREPKICSENSSRSSIEGLPLPIRSIPCMKCDTGYFRNVVSGKCEKCPPNSYSQDSRVCLNCHGVGVHEYEFRWENYESYPSFNNFKTSCTGMCNTNGWELEHVRISSGRGHPGRVKSEFSIDIKVVNSSSVKYTLSFFNCIKTCLLKFSIRNIVTGEYSTLEVSSGDGSLFNVNKEIVAGYYTLTWSFQNGYKNPGALATITSISVDNTDMEHGGLLSCNKNSEETFNLLDLCFAQCPSGTYNDRARRGRCLYCSENTFSEYDGSNTCTKCGVNTFNGAGLSWCRNCMFKESEKIVYDINNLSEIDGLSISYSNVPVNGTHTLHLGLCTRESNHPCYSEEGSRYYYTPTCLVSNETGNGVDFGRIANFYPLKNGSDYGFVLKYTDSKADEHINCDDTNISLKRSTTIRFICDVNAGVGRPILNNYDKCNLNFLWKSSYGCPLCNKDNWICYEKMCVDGSNITKCFWKDRRCNGGERIPSSNEDNCDSNCPAGNYYLKENVCEKCPKNKYSLGNSNIYNLWKPDKNALEISQVGFKNYINSAVANLHGTIDKDYPKLSLNLNFGDSAKVEWVFFALIARGHLVDFSIDRNIEKTITGPYFEKKEVRFNATIDPGNHLLEWELKSHNLDEIDQIQFSFLYIIEIRAINLQVSDVKCFDPAPGYVFKSSEEEPINCLKSKDLDACKNASHLREVGSNLRVEVIQNTEKCSYLDYYVSKIGICKEDHLRNVEFTKDESSNCNGSDSLHKEVFCECEFGMDTHAGSECLNSPELQYYDERETKFEDFKEMKTVKFWSLIQKRFLFPIDNHYSGCIGICKSPWKFLVDTDDSKVISRLKSGILIGNSISVFEFNVEMSEYGKLIVDYEIVSGSEVNFYVLIDEVIVLFHCYNGTIMETGNKQFGDSMWTKSYLNGSSSTKNSYKKTRSEPPDDFEQSQIRSESYLKYLSINKIKSVKISLLAQSTSESSLHPWSVSINDLIMIGSEKGVPTFEQCNESLAEIGKVSCSYYSPHLLSNNSIEKKYFFDGEEYFLYRHEKSEINTSILEVQSSIYNLSNFNQDEKFKINLFSVDSEDQKYDSNFSVGIGDVLDNNNININNNVNLESENVRLFYKASDSIHETLVLLKVEFFCKYDRYKRNLNKIIISCSKMQNDSKFTHLTNISEPCYNVFKWESEYACRTCFKDDYMVINDQCKLLHEKPELILKRNDCVRDPYYYPLAATKSCFFYYIYFLAVFSVSVIVICGIFVFVHLFPVKERIRELFSKKKPKDSESIEHYGKYFEKNEVCTDSMDSSGEFL